MTQTTLTVGYARRPDPEKDNPLRIGQKSWESIGRTTTADVIHGLGKMFFDLEMPEDDCGKGVDGVSVQTEIYIYTPASELSFDVGVTHGEISEGVYGAVTVTEALEFHRDYVAELENYPSSAVKTSWAGAVYDGNGDAVAAPSITVSGAEIKIDRLIYGTLNVTYTTRRYVYTLTIPPRDEPENVYQTVVWAAWNGGATLFEVDPPPGAEEDYKNNTDCNNRGSWNVGIIPDEDEWQPPTVPPGGETTIVLDYCKLGEGYYAE